MSFSWRFNVPLFLTVCIKEVARCFNGVSRKFQKKISRCFKEVSSQLPEQKEGLFSYKKVLS